MLIRATVLTVALLLGVGTMLPMMTDYTQAGPKQSRKAKKKRAWKVKKYSKKWWALYRRQQQRNRQMIARRRALRARQILIARQTKPQTGDAKRATPAVAGAKAAQSPTASPNGTQQYRLTDESGNPMGSASLSVVGIAGTDAGGKTLGGVSTGALRRTVIDKMVREEGWVVNDYQKDLNGEKVYVVVAQSPVRGSVQSRLFYFTEVDGRIYSLATTAPQSAQERLAQESERVLNSLQRTNRSAEAGLR